MKSVFVVAVLGGLIACGDNHHNQPDANVQPIDAPVPIDAPKPPPDAAPITCNYQEQHDATNDFNSMPTPGLEDTGLTFSGSTMSICGLINTGSAHFDSMNGTIDVDNYGITVAQDSDVLITLTSSGSNVAAIAAISAVNLSAFSDQAGFTVASSYWAAPGGNHAIVSAHLPAGSYELGVEAADSASAAAVTGPALPYALTISADNPSVRCTTVTGTASYVESGDGPANHANDMVEIDMNGTAIALGAGSDTPENTHLTLAPSTDYLITGDSAAVAAATDTYYDMDTYQVTPGPNADQLSVRLDWQNQTANLDYYLFEAGHLGTNAAFITASTANMEEFGTTAVVPGVPYWISVGEFAAPMTSSVDTPYSLTLCSETFVPPPN